MPRLNGNIRARLARLGRTVVGKRKQAQARLLKIKGRARLAKMEEQRKFAHICSLFVPLSQRAQRYEESMREFDGFCKSVEEYAFDIDGIHAATWVYGIDQEGRRREIGQFHLTISKDTVSWENMTRTMKAEGYSNWHAPYISFNKTVCGLSDETLELQLAIAEGRIRDAVQVMKIIAGQGPGYVKGCRITDFPLADER